MHEYMLNSVLYNNMETWAET